MLFAESKFQVLPIETWKIFVALKVLQKHYGFGILEHYLWLKENHNVQIYVCNPTQSNS